LRGGLQPQPDGRGVCRIPGARKVEVYSAGSRPSGHVNRQAVEAMQELGYDLTQHRSKSLVDLANLDFDLAVTMGCGDECPFIRAKHREDLQIPDPKNLPLPQFRQLRTMIEENVKQLLASYRRRSGIASTILLHRKQPYLGAAPTQLCKLRNEPP
jgi:arsenate reductase (thioredoxin)